MRKRVRTEEKKVDEGEKESKKGCLLPRKGPRPTKATQKEEQVKSLVFQPNSVFLVVSLLDELLGRVCSGVNPGLLGLASTTVSIASASGRVRFLIRGQIACPVLYYSSMPAGDNAKKEGGAEGGYEKVCRQKSGPAEYLSCVAVGNVKEKRGKKAWAMRPEVEAVVDR